MLKKEYKGMWFLPDKPEEQIAGILYFDPKEKISLELIGSLGEKSGFSLFVEPQIHFPVIHGIVYKEDNKASKITLFDCYFSGTYNTSCEFALSKFRCTFILVGKLLNTKEDRIFDKIQIHFPCLKDWYPYRPIKLDNDGYICQWEVGSEKNKYLKTFSIDDNSNLILNAYAGFNTTDKGYNLYQDAYLEIEGSIKSSFAELRHKADLFRDFLSLAVLTDVPFSEILLYDNDDFQQLNDNKKIMNVTQLFFVTERYSTDKYPIYNYLFRFTDVEPVFADIIRKWYNESNQLAPIRQHLIKSITYNKVFESVDFLIVIQAIEGFFLRFIPNRKENLKTKLENLYEKFNTIAVLNNNIVDTDKTVISRHYYSHFFEKEPNVCDGLELFDITKKLKLLLICCVLSVVGFSNDEINAFLNNSNKIREEYS
jgi:hypothetical protein